MKPMIGIMPLWDEDRNSLWMLPGYLEGIRCAGGIPVIFPITDSQEDLHRLVDLMDGFVFTGGQDVSPELYGEEPLNKSVICCEIRDRMEKTVIDLAFRQNKSVLGICRGIQFLNVYLGGTLYQDLPTQHPASVIHSQNPPHDIPCHEVSLIDGSPLYELLKTGKLAVNSYHHQAIKELGQGLCKMAESNDGLIEAVYMPNRKFVWAVQWHPEFLYTKDQAQKKLFEAFVDSMKS